VIGAVDIGGTKIAVGMVDNNGRVLSRAECPTDSGRGYPGAHHRHAPGNVYEVLQVEEGIARVRGDIERMEAEQKNLEHRGGLCDCEFAAHGRI
jgi:hypothetical protein